MKALIVFGRKWIYDTSLPLEARKLNIACLFGFLACVLSFIARVIEQPGEIPLITVAIMALSVLGLFLVVNKYKLVRAGSLCIVLVMCEVMFPILFLTNGGIDSAVNCFFVLCMTLCFILVKGWMRVLSITLFTVTVLFLYINASMDAPLIPILPEGGLSLFQQLVDNIQSIFISGLFIGLVVIFQHQIYEDEKSRADLAVISLTQATEEALASSRAKSDFLSNMSHEIRTPINAIIGMTELARSSEHPERTEYYLSRVHEASSHLLGVINDVLDMSKIEADKMTLAEVPFSFRAMVDRAVSIVAFRIAEREQQLSLTISPDIPDILMGDDQRLTQVLTNLLSNAVKFTPDGGKIGLSAHLLAAEPLASGLSSSLSASGLPAPAAQLPAPAEPLAATAQLLTPEPLAATTQLPESAAAAANARGSIANVCVEVSDTGIGITEEQRTRLFNSFEQADSSTSRQFGGTGLGLAISRRIIELAGGSIEVDSVPGEGSTFRFNVRLAVGAGDAIGASAASGASAAGGIAAADGANKSALGKSVLGDATNDTSDGAAKTAASQTKKQAPAHYTTIENRTFADYDKKSELLRNLNNEDFSASTILVAEDNEVNREILAAMLESTRINIDFAKDGEEAVRSFEAAPELYGLIFMDLQMPQVNGFEATRRIRALDTPRAATIPIVAMTANVFQEDIDNCLACGMNSHLGKPLDLAAIIETLKLHLG